MYQKELEIAKEASLLAAKEILKIYNSNDFKVEYKSDKTPVTIADKLADKIIRKHLSDNSSFYILSEETKDNLTRLKEEYLWIVDPIDGTKEFINKNDEFAINIALIKEKEVVLGLIYMPVYNELYYAIKGKGAYLNNKKIRVSDKVNDIRVLRTRSTLNPKLYKIYEDKRVKVVEKVGSSYKACLVARGDYEAHYSSGYTKEWDFAPMHIIVEEAGGIFMKLNGEKMLYNKKELVNREGFLLVNNKKNIIGGLDD